MYQKWNFRSLIKYFIILLFSMWCTTKNMAQLIKAEPIFEYIKWSTTNLQQKIHKIDILRKIIKNKKFTQIIC